MKKPFFLFLDPKTGKIYAEWAEKCFYHNYFSDDGSYQWVIKYLPRGMQKIGEGTADGIIDMLRQQKEAREKAAAEKKANEEEA